MLEVPVDCTCQFGFNHKYPNTEYVDVENFRNVSNYSIGTVIFAYVNDNHLISK